MSLKSPRRLLASFSVIAVLSAGGFLLQEAVRHHDHELAVLQHTLESEAILLAEHAQLALSATDRLLQTVVWDRDRARMQVHLADLSFYQHVLSTSQFAGLIVTDAKGELLFTARSLPLPLANVTDQAFFQVHREGAHYSLGHPVTLGDDQRLFIPVSQRLSDAAGNFAGVAVVLLDVAYFRRFYAEVSQQLQFRIGMFRSNGTLLTLYPAPLKDLSSSSAGLEALFSQQHAQVLVHDSPLDGSRRITAYRRLYSSPAVVTVSYSHDAFMAGLIPDLLRSGLVFLFILAGVGGAAVLINRTMRTAYRAREAQLGFQRQHQETLQLCHTIARNLPNGRVFVLDEAMRYIFVEGQTWQNEPSLQASALIGRTIQEVYPPHVSAILTVLVSSALAGTEADEEVIYKARVYRAFTTPLPDDDGTTRRCLLLTQDITQFKQDQRALETLNQKLHHLASSDGLLGIANRREFERVLELEWQRGLRDSQPLSLLLIDIDCFKQYNDSYGHPEGDACLQQVAVLLGEALRRPSDLVARYGGEEMAVLLPNTDQEGGWHVAQRIHTLLKARAIPFEASPVSDYVTVSIGVAAYVPASNGSPSMLVEHADAALYLAKGGGRNQTELFRGISAPLKPA